LISNSKISFPVLATHSNSVSALIIQWQKSLSKSQFRVVGSA
jgi:hypothetical protein